MTRDAAATGFSPEWRCRRVVRRVAGWLWWSQAPVSGLYMIHGSPAYRAERVADQPSTVRT